MTAPADDLSTGSCVGGIQGRAKHRVRGVPSPDELHRYSPDLVDRDRKPQADAAALASSERVLAQCVDGRIDPDDLTAAVHKWTARIAGIDRCISLDRVEKDLGRVVSCRARLHWPLNGADDSAGHGIHKSEWGTYRDYRVPDCHAG